VESTAEAATLLVVLKSWLVALKRMFGGNWFRNSESRAHGGILSGRIFLGRRTGRGKPSGLKECVTVAIRDLFCFESMSKGDIWGGSGVVIVVFVVGGGSLFGISASEPYGKAGASR
jgi:hypothetical protein